MGALNHAYPCDAT